MEIIAAKEDLESITQEEGIDISSLISSVDQIISLIQKVLAYMEAKRTPSSDIRPLFPNLSLPSVWQVGALVELNGGHTREFSWREELKLNTHLLAAQFGDSETSSYLQDLVDESQHRSGASAPAVVPE